MPRKSTKKPARKPSKKPARKPSKKPARKPAKKPAQKPAKKSFRERKTLYVVFDGGVLMAFFLNRHSALEYGKYFGLRVHEVVRGNEWITDDSKDAFGLVLSPSGKELQISDGSKKPNYKLHSGSLLLTTTDEKIAVASDLDTAMHMLKDIPVAYAFEIEDYDSSLWREEGVLNGEVGYYKWKNNRFKMIKKKFYDYCTDSTKDVVYSKTRPFTNVARTTCPDR